MNKFFQRAGSMGIFFLFSLIVLGFCIYILTQGGGLLSQIITGVFALISIYLLAIVIRKFREKE